jgi:pimeloyl-ACP methyl ester carboxylesterase
MVSHTAAILVHGMGQCSRGWSESCQDLLRKGARTWLRPDQTLEFVEVTYSDVLDEALSRGASEVTEQDEYQEILMQLMMATSDPGPQAEGELVPVGARTDVAQNLLTYVAGYFSKENERQRAQERLIEALGKVQADHKVLVAHSLGSIVSWDVLSKPGSSHYTQVNHFVTLGSPLQVLSRVNHLLGPLARVSFIQKQIGDLDSRVDYVVGGPT